MANRPSRKRPAPTKISKPFPWGMVAGSTLLAAALIGIIVYAALNQGAGFEDPVERADRSFPGVQVADGLSRDHVAGEVAYPTVVPMGGEHSPVPQQCAVYDAEIPAEHAVHSLEHGAAWVTYRPDLPADQVATLTGQVEANPYGLMSPAPGQTEPILLTAWGRQLAVQTADDERVAQFLDSYADGPQTPERGAACAGNTTTGSTPAGAPPVAPQSPPAASPGASTPESPAPTPSS